MRKSKAELRMKIRDLETKLLNLEDIAKQKIQEIEKLRADNHTCDEYCDGCVHLIKHGNHYFDTVYSGAVMKGVERRCALDRKCRHYEAKEN